MTHRLYHEKQEAGLCGVHCLNTLLQSPMFSEIDLATIARQLDSKERQLMAEAGTDTNDFLKYMAEDSGNVADDGNYSVQVLSEALKVFGVEVLPLGRQKAPADITAFICNLAEHWFTLRRVYGHWWDFNSLNSAPRWISDLALDVTLETLRQQGYSIFMIRGNLPAPNPNSSSGLSLGGRGRWLNVAAGSSASRKADADLEAAIKASLAGSSKPAAKPSERSVIDMSGDDDLAAAIAASLATPEKPGAGGNAPKRSAPIPEEEDDPELAAALALSRQESASLPLPPAKDAKPTPAPALASTLAPIATPTPASAPAQPVLAPAPLVFKEPPPEPAAGPGVLNIGIRMPDGSRFQRRFNESNTLTDLHVAVAHRISSNDFTLISNGPPKRDLAGLPQSTLLSEAGVANSLLILEKR